MCKCSRPCKLRISTLFDFSVWQLNIKNTLNLLMFCLLAYLFWLKRFPDYACHSGRKVLYPNDRTVDWVINKRIVFVVDKHHRQAVVFRKYLLYADVMFVFAHELPLIYIEVTYVSSLFI
jgi:hypothetical protein